jgi:Uma2 family endonuclease
MSAAISWNLVSVEEYLAAELDSPVKHEYLAGVVYAMAGARNSHNLIATSTIVAVGARLRGLSCRPYNSDTKIRIRMPNQVRFYYPDASVICRANPASDSYQDEPVVLFEVLSRETRRIDEGEKKEAYLTISSLGVYVLVEQHSQTVVLFRRSETGFTREVYSGLEAVMPLPEIGIELPLAEIYDGVEFTPRAEGGEDAEG